MMISILYFLKILTLLIIGLSLLYALLGLILSLWSVNPKKSACDETAEVFITTNGLHLDIIFPIATLEPSFLKMLELKSNVQFVAFGWGDRGFYLDTPTWAEVKVSTVAKALFVNSPSVMHVTKYFQQGKSWRRVPVCDHQLATLKAHTKASFQKTDNGQFIKIKDAGYGPTDEFYEAEGYYTCIRTCNVWVNQALKKAQIKTAVWSPTDFGVLYHLE
ncbi:MAG: TIGR02117 family protein [Bacteroidota bacterium]